jgi:glycolate oxidase FAD binding subunit
VIAGLETVLRDLLGEAAHVECDRSGMPCVAPRNEEALARLLQSASEASWKVRIEGHGHWMPADAPADFVVTTRCLEEIPYFSPADLVATVGAGLSWSELQRHLADQGAWVALDAPGNERTAGSIVSTGTAGSLRGSHGNARDHVLGLTLVTGDGRVLHLGGIVVKNVAGFDIAKLATGSFGAFGIITAVTFRLRAVPSTETTLLGTGMRDALLGAVEEILVAGITPAALELLCPAASGTADWRLAVRLIGSKAEVAATRDTVCGAANIKLLELTADEASRQWHSILSGTTEHPTTIRLGALPSSIGPALDLIAHHLAGGCSTVATAAGSIRWSGTATVEELRLLRDAAAQRQIPLTFERGPWSIRESIGHFGAYREGVGPLVRKLRETFDPAGILVTSLEAQP